MLPDLPLHGDSEDRPRHPYTLAWLAEVMAAFCLRDRGARTRSSAATTSAPRSCCARSSPAQLEPAKLVLMPNCLHRPPERAALRCDVAGDDARGRGPRASTASSATARGARSGPTSG